MQADGWLGLELRHLVALKAIAEHRSFSGAARALGYTQSAISQQISTLERIVGSRLVDRPGGPRPVSLTDTGQLLLSHADGIAARLQAAQADLRALGDGRAGLLRVGTYQSVGARILPTLFGRFRSEWPDVDVRLTESSDDAELLALVERGELDLTFCVLPPGPGPFEVEELLRDPYVLVVAADSPLARRARPPSIDEIAELPLIGYRQCRTMLKVESHLRAAGREAQIVFRSDDNGTVQGLVAAGVGAALVPRLTVNELDDAVAVLEVAGRIPPRMIGLARHRDRLHTQSAAAFVAEARAVCADYSRATTVAAA
jgi:DNA-binding transcriptional LysR family regulator